MSTVQTAPAPLTSNVELRPREITIYDHSTLMYWWPVWVVGYLLALLTLLQGETFQFENAQVLILPSKNPGVIFTVVTVLIIVMTHTTVRGNASLTVIVSILAVTLFFAYMGWWDDVFRAIDRLAIFMNLGFYVFFSTAVFVVWFLAVFVFDRLTYCTFRPGQMQRRTVFGGGVQTYDTQGMSVQKKRDDLFRHWVLGMGSGDLQIATTGAHAQEFVLHNVLFIGRKIQTIEELVAMKPDETTEQVAVRIGDPN